MVLDGTFYTTYEKRGGGYLVSFHKNYKHKLLALGIFRLIRPDSRVQIDTDSIDL